eukprot:62745-Hanusia_phi.AAC.1
MDWTRTRIGFRSMVQVPMMPGRCTEPRSPTALLARYGTPVRPDRTGYASTAAGSESAARESLRLTDSRSHGGSG